MKSSQDHGGPRGLQPARRDLLVGLAGGAIGLGLGSESRAMPAGTLPAGDDGTQDWQPFYGRRSRQRRWLRASICSPRIAPDLSDCFEL